MADQIAKWRVVWLTRHHHAPRGMMPCEACHSAYKRNPPPPPQLQVRFARALGLLERSLGRNRGLEVYLRGFLGSFWSERLFSRYSLSL